jgi:trans-feruloyl-CoA hydratase/vanillin synthase
MALKKYETILVDKKEGIGWITFNRPDKRNAMTPQLHLDMNDALDEFALDSDVAVLVITGAGKAFCAGQDIGEYFRGTADNPKLKYQASQASRNWRWRKLSRFPKPTIAMINGYCFGGAFTQVTACDFAIAANDAIFGLSEVNWGIIPGGIVSWNVVEMMSFRDAMYYAVTGDTFTGKEAEKIRFINKAVPKARLRAETIELAKKLMRKSPAAVRFTKDAIRSVRYMSVDQADDYLMGKFNALEAVDKEKSRQKGMKQFLDDKTYRPGLGEFDRSKKL